jgi:hypothetical protein
MAQKLLYKREDVGIKSNTSTINLLQLFLYRSKPFLTMTPSTQKQWTVNGHDGIESFKLNENAPVPQLGEKDVLVKREHYAKSTFLFSN